MVGFRTHGGGELVSCNIIFVVTNGLEREGTINMCKLGNKKVCFIRGAFKLVCLEIGVQTRGSPFMNISRFSLPWL